MIVQRKIKVGKKYAQALKCPLGTKNLIVIKGKSGYIACGYIDLSIAAKFNEVAVKISGVSNIKEALSAQVDSCTVNAKKMGIYKGQPIKDVLKIIV